MKNSEFGGAQVVLTALTAIIGGAVLLTLPDLIPKPFNMLGWGLVAINVIAGLFFFHNEKAQKKLAEKEKEQKRLKRSRNLRQEKEKQEKQIEAAREKLIRKEEKAAEKLSLKKKKLEQEAKATWDARVKKAQEKEIFFKTVIANTNQMPIRNAAGKAAFEWNEASSVAHWILQQVAMFMQRPDVTNQAREAAREAIIESLRVKQSGGSWSKEDGLKLAYKKEQAAKEEKIEETRLREIRNEIENANLKWRAAKQRANRWHDELEKLMG